MKIYNSHLIGESNVSSSMGNILYSQFSGSFKGDGSGLTNVPFPSPFSSSILPFTASGELTSFSIGSLSSPWRSLYVSTASSIIFTNESTALVSITGGRNKISIGNTFISTASVGFGDAPIIIKYTESDTRLILTGSTDVIGDGSTSIMKYRSGSFIATEIDSEGVFKIGQFTYMPSPRVGGLIFSGSNLYIGV